MNEAEPAQVYPINVVGICPTEKVRNALIAAIEAAGGPRPGMKSDSESAKRAHYPPMMSKIILNTASAKMHQLLGKHYLVLAVEAKDRASAAERAKKAFEDAGFPAQIHSRAEPEFPDGFLIFIQVPAMKGIVLMIWPTPDAVTPELAATLPKREPWDGPK